MLRRADNASLVLRPRLFGKADVYLRAGKREWKLWRRVPRARFYDWTQDQRGYPQHVHIRELNRTYWNFRDRWWWDKDGLAPDQVHALLVTQMQREQARIERAQAMVATGAQPRSTSREAIPDDVKQFVWQRDQGRCRACGATTELQFDHVIPVALGGNSNAENLQVLCGPCNRRKGAGLTVR